MRRIHSAAMAEALKQHVSELSPPFRPISASEAKVLGTQKRMSFSAAFPCGGIGYLLFEPSGTARDNYFTLDVVWSTAPQLMDWLNTVYFLPTGRTALDLLRAPPVRLRASCLWHDAADSFEFSTASSRFNDQLFASARTDPKGTEAAIGESFQKMMSEEDRLTPEEALAEVGPALERCFELIRRDVLPLFQEASRYVATRAV